YNFSIIISITKERYYGNYEYETKNDGYFMG
ncbi:hypothetical protein Q604_UNBC01332G0002, partial [human gut metagenome]